MAISRVALTAEGTLHVLPAMPLFRDVQLLKKVGQDPVMYRVFRTAMGFL